MKKKIDLKKSISVMTIVLSVSCYGQVGVNTKTPNSIFDVSAKRDASGAITDNTQTYGLQAPRLTRAELTNNLATYSTDQNGALIYITNVSGGSATPGTQQENITAVGYYYFDAAAASNAGRWQKIAFGSGGNTYTASNGLNLSGSNIKLGGTLTENTTITQGNNPLNINGNSSLNLATTNTSANPLNITYPLNNLAASGILISGASGTPATGQSASIGLNPNASQGTSPVSIGAQYINGSSGQGAADFFVATSSGNISTKKFIIQNGGNVGIDVTSPNEKLDVNGNVKFRAVPNSSTLDSNDKIMVLASDGTGKKVDVSLVQSNQSTADNGLTKTGNNIQLGGTLTKETTIAQNGNNMIFSGSGSVGIGATAPAAKLDVQGNQYINASVTSAASKNAIDINVGQDSYSYGNRTDNFGINMKSNSSASAGSISRINFGDESTTSLTGNKYLSFSVGRPLNELMYLTSSNSGRVGIGTTTPDAKLDVQGNQYINASITSATSKNAIDINVGQDSYSYGNRTDNFGINMKSNSSNTSAGQISRINFGDESTTTLGGDKYLSFSVGKPLNELMYLTSGNGGRVGIGTTSPSQPLDVNGNIKFRAVPNSSTLNSTDKIMVLESDGTGKKVDVSLVQPNATTANNGLTKTGDNIKLGGSLTENTTIAQGNNSMNFSGNSNVNISTTNSSAYPLSITQPLTSNLSTPGLQIGGASGASAAGQAAFIGLNPNNSQGAWPVAIGAQYINSSSGQSSADFFVATSNGGPADKKLVVSNTGNVGVGTTNPSAKLEINNVGGSVAALKVKNLNTQPASANAAYVTIDNTTGEFYKGLQSEKAFYYQVYNISNVQGDWVSSFDTKVSTNDYTVIVVGSYFDKLLGVNNINTTSSRFTPQNVYAYKNTSTNTWTLSADFPNVNSKADNASDANQTPNGKWTIYTMIVRNNQVVTNNDVNVNLNGNNSGSASASPVP